MNVGDRVRIKDTDYPPGHDYSCDGVTGVVTLIEEGDTPGFEMAHDAPWQHMDLNFYRADMAEVLA